MTLYNSRNKVVWELTAQERAAKVTWELAEGNGMTTAQVAEMTGLSTMGAWHLMQRVCRVAPVTQDEGGEWRRLR